jgi:N-acetylmuramoyl-L-alanine amidase
MIRFCLASVFFLSVSAFSQTPSGATIAGKTTGALPYFEYGLGTDRLGGAKMGYLDTGIVVKVVDSTIGTYKIQLSREHFAYLPKTNFKKDSSVRVQTYYLTSSWMVSGDENTIM